jgi:hypothetical protein
MSTHKLTDQILIAAIDGFEAQKKRIDEQIAELRQMLEGSRTAPAATSDVPARKRRKMSAASRKRMGDAQRKRWAGAKRRSEHLPATPEVPKPKRRLSRAGRAAIVAATKKRWALKRAEDAKAASAKAASAKALTKAAGE